MNEKTRTRCRNEWRELAWATTLMALMLISILR